LGCIGQWTQHKNSTKPIKHPQTIEFPD
jgi:hypothetical protein